MSFLSNHWISKVRISRSVCISAQYRHIHATTYKRFDILSQNARKYSLKPLRRACPIPRILRSVWDLKEWMASVGLSPSPKTLKNTWRFLWNFKFLFSSVVHILILRHNRLFHISQFPDWSDSRFWTKHQFFFEKSKDFSPPRLWVTPHPDFGDGKIY